MRVPPGGRLLEYIAVKFSLRCKVLDVDAMLKTYKLVVIVNDTVIAEEALANLPAEDEPWRWVFHVNYQVKAGDKIGASLVGEPFQTRGALDIQTQIHITGTFKAGLIPRLPRSNN